MSQAGTAARQRDAAMVTAVLRLEAAVRRVAARLDEVCVGGGSARQP